MKRYLVISFLIFLILVSCTPEPKIPTLPPHPKVHTVVYQYKVLTPVPDAHVGFLYHTCNNTLKAFEASIKDTSFVVGMHVGDTPFIHIDPPCSSTIYAAIYVDSNLIVDTTWQCVLFDRLDLISKEL